MKSGKKTLALGIATIVVIGTLLMVPYFSSRFYLQIFVFTVVFIILASSYDIMIGHLGLLSLAHPLFFGTGAYVSAWLAKGFHVPFVLVLIAAGILAVIVSLIVGVLALRASYHAFGLITLGFSYGTYYGVYNWLAIGGPDGIPNLPNPSIGPFVLNSLASKYYLGLILLGITLLLIHRIINSRVGRAFHALNDNEILAKSFGVNPKTYKYLGFALSAFFAGIAGAYYALTINYAGPDAFNFPWTVNLLIMVLAGGSRIFGGVILGAIIFGIIPDVLRITAQLRQVLFGIILLTTLIFFPDGIGGFLLKQLNKVKGKVTELGDF